MRKSDGGKLEVRNSKLETRNPKPETRNKFQMREAVKGEGAVCGIRLRISDLSTLFRISDFGFRIFP